MISAHVSQTHNFLFGIIEKWYLNQRYSPAFYSHVVYLITEAYKCGRTVWPSAFAQTNNTATNLRKEGNKDEREFVNEVVLLRHE